MEEEIKWNFINYFTCYIWSFVV